MISYEKFNNFNNLQTETLAACFQSGLLVLKAPSALFDLYVDK